MDRGHKKKANAKTNVCRDNPGYNPFQECQTQRNTWTVSNSSNGTNNNGTTSTQTQSNQLKTQIYRQNPHKHRFHHKFSQRNGGNANGRTFNKNFNHFQRQTTNK